MKISFKFRQSFLFLFGLGLSLSAGDFNGWQDMRIVKCRSQSQVMESADIDGDGRDELIIANPRKSRFDIFRYLPKSKRAAINVMSRPGVNELPMAPELKHDEIFLNDIPADFKFVNLDNDKTLELVMISVLPGKLIVLDKTKSGKWVEKMSWKLGKIRFASPRPLLLKVVKNRIFALLSCRLGVKQLELKQGAEFQWLKPQEKGIMRHDWWWSDLDNDGDKDLLEWRNHNGEALQWYETIGGTLQPPRVLGDTNPYFVHLFNDDKGEPQVVLLNKNSPGILSHFTFKVSEVRKFGAEYPLPLINNQQQYAGIVIDGKKCLVQVDSQKPRIVLYELTVNGWVSGDSYPISSGVRKMVALPARPGTLLFQVENSNTLLISKWKNGRFSYPVALSKGNESKIIRIERIDGMVWWLKKAGDDLLLYTWEKDSKAEKCTVFAGAGKIGEDAYWFGGNALAVKGRYSRSAKLVALKNKKIIISTPPQLKNADFTDFRLIKYDGKIHCIKLLDGVVQWLGDDLIEVDQTMLNNDKLIASFIPSNGKSAWALEKNSKNLHLLKPDKAGILRSSQKYQVAKSATIKMDPVLGMILVQDGKLTVLEDGSRLTLDLVESSDKRQKQFNGERESMIHKIFVADITGNGKDELLFLNNEKHLIEVLDPSNDFATIISWKVFDDNKYPYGRQQKGNYVNINPSNIIGINLDGDDKQDLVLSCHDRLIFYFGAKQTNNKKVK